MSSVSGECSVCGELSVSGNNPSVLVASVVFVVS